MNAALASTVADRDGELLEKLEAHFPAVATRFGPIAVVATEATDIRVLDLLRESGASIATRPPDDNGIGRHRREALGLALDISSNGHISYIDLDHVLRWIENDPDELDGILNAAGSSDCLVIGRGPKSWESLPRRLATTEAIVNEMYRLLRDRRWDLMMASRLLSRRAAEAIVAECTVDTIGNDVAWPLLCEARGLSLDYVAAEGLTYKTNRDYANGLEDDQDEDPRAWATRVRQAWQCVEAMAPYMSERRGD